MPNKEGRQILGKYLIDRHPRHLAEFVLKGHNIPLSFRKIFAEALKTAPPRPKPSGRKRNVLRDLEVYLAVTEWRDLNRRPDGKLPSLRPPTSGALLIR
jgi:hypothetical protein